MITKDQWPKHVFLCRKCATLPGWTSDGTHAIGCAHYRTRAQNNFTKKQTCDDHAYYSRNSWNAIHMPATYVKRYLC